MTHTIAALGSPVEVLRDAHGIPHVFAGSARDAFLAQGFVHAQDRLWQMVYDRMRAAGRSAELIGARGVTFDAFARRMDLVAVARAEHALLTGEERIPFEAYAEGVNAFLATGVRPLELELLGLEPDPWTAVDCHAAWKVRHVLMGSMGTKLWRARLRDVLGEEAAIRLASPDGREELLIVPPGATMRWDADGDELRAGADALGDGSNSWALSGARTASGAPLLAGDPHRLLETPNVYAQLQLACDEFDVVGLTIPGVPGFPHFGHNGTVAWSITHAMADDQDLYVERFDADGRVHDADGWRPVERRRETIRVHDAADVEIEIVRTPRGPIVYGEPASGRAIALRWTGADEPRRGLACLGPMLAARTAAEMDAAMRDWTVPCNSMLIADTGGEIRYLHRGRVPIRPSVNGWHPVAGDDPRFAWQGDLSFEELPRCVNPSEHLLVTANNRVIDDGRHFAMDYAAPNRARRILDRLRALGDDADAAAMTAIHADVRSLAVVTFTEALRAAVDEPLLEGFEGDMELGSIPASIVTEVREALLDLLLDGPAWKQLAVNPFTEEPLPVAPRARLRSALQRLLPRAADPRITDGRTWDALLKEGHANAITRLRERHGEDPSAWGYREDRGTNIRHVLTARFPDAGLDAPVRALGGDGDTVFVAASEPGFGVYHASVARYVFDLADRDASGWIVPLGAAGDARDPHAFDQAEAWSRAELLPIIGDRERLRAVAAARTRLDPTL